MQTNIDKDRSAQVADFYNYYEIEAKEYAKKTAKEADLFLYLLKITGIFLTITLVIFFVVNYSFIKSQLIDQERDQWVSKRSMN